MSIRLFIANGTRTAICEANGSHTSVADPKPELKRTPEAVLLEHVSQELTRARIIAARAMRLKRRVAAEKAVARS